jgi:hypothetical protein
MARVRLTAAVLAALAVGLPAHSALAATKGPQELRGFTLRATEPVVHTFSRTPSFAWNPVAGAKSYEFQLGTSKDFHEGGIVWETEGVRSPAVAIPISLPWITGKPYSLYAHVRAVTRKGATPWSAPFGFNMRWSTLPVPLTPSYPGLLRWTNVPGASGYQLWLIDAGKWFTTRSNQADEREYYTFHQNPAFSGVVHWRVRATRWLYGQTANGLPSVSYGPWSPVYSSYNPPFPVGLLTAKATVSNVVSDASATRAHEIMPAFTYSGDTSMWGTSEELYRVEVFTDEDCINPVFRGAIVGSPAYVPRPTGPLALPTDVAGITAARTAFLPDGTEPDSYTFDGVPVKGTESSASPASGGSGTSLPPSLNVTGAHVDLWDSDWPGGRYYWTVMPIEAVPDQQVSTTLAAPVPAGSTDVLVANATGIAAGNTLRVGTVPEHAVVKSVAGNLVTLGAGLAAFHAAGEPVDRPAGGVTYREPELTQDSCASGRVLAFGKSGEPVVTGHTAPFASGLSPNGKLVAAAGSQPRFYGQPLVAWQPAVAADQYEVQWSHTRYPWKTAGSQQTWGTSLTLPLTPGTWFYRVRGLDALMIGTRPQLSWSDPVKLVVTKPRFRVVG